MVSKESDMFHSIDMAVRHAREYLDFYKCYNKITPEEVIYEIIRYARAEYDLHYDRIKQQGAPFWKRDADLSNMKYGTTNHITSYLDEKVKYHARKR